MLQSFIPKRRGRPGDCFANWILLSPSEIMSLGQLGDGSGRLDFGHSFRSVPQLQPRQHFLLCCIWILKLLLKLSLNKS